MRAELSSFFLAALAGTAAAAAKLPGTDMQLAVREAPRSTLSERELYERGLFDLDYEHPFSWTLPQGESIINKDGLEVACIECQFATDVHFVFDYEFFSPDSSYLNLSLAGTAGYIDLDVTASGSITETYTLVPLGDFDIGDFSATLGLKAGLELVVTVEGEVEVTGGVQFTIPDDSWVAVAMNKTIPGVGTHFGGAVMEWIPWKVQHGEATITLSLRLQTELGFEVEIGSHGVGAVLGGYVNLFESVTQLEYDADDTACELELSESWNINAGVYVEGLALVTTVSADEVTTLYTGSTISTCLDSLFGLATTATTTDAVESQTQINAPNTPTPTETSTQINAPNTPTPTETSTQINLPNTPITPTETPTQINLPNTPITPTETPTQINLPNTPISASQSHIQINLPNDAIISSADTSTDRNILATPTHPHGHNGSSTWIPGQSHVTSTPYAAPTKLYNNATITSPAVMHTSTVCSTSVYTITSCAANIVHCPKSWQQEVVVTSIVDLYTTVCPVGETQTLPPPTTTSVPLRVISITNGITLSACKTPIVHVISTPSGVQPPQHRSTTITVHRTLPGEPAQTASVKSVNVEDDHTWLPNADTTVRTKTVKAVSTVAYSQGQYGGENNAETTVKTNTIKTVTSTAVYSQGQYGGESYASTTPVGQVSQTTEAALGTETPESVQTAGAGKLEGGILGAIVVLMAGILAL